MTNPVFLLLLSAVLGVCFGFILHEHNKDTDVSLDRRKFRRPFRPGPAISAALDNLLQAAKDFSRSSSK